MYCWHCGTKLPSVAAFCYRCGQSQAPDAVFDPAVRGIAPDGWSWSHLGATSTPPTSTASSDPPPTVTIPWSGPNTEASAASRPAPAPVPDRLNPIGGILAIGCGLLVVAGSFGPWVTAHFRFLGSIQINGSQVDGRVTAWCGVAAVTCLLLPLVAPQRRGLLSTIATIAFFCAAVIGASDWTSVSESLRELRASGDIALLRAEIGWGLRAVTFGGIGGTLLALMQWMHARAARRARRGSV